MAISVVPKAGTTAKPDAKLRIILVPGVGTSPPVEDWGFLKGVWSEELSIDGNHIDVSGHYPTVSDETRFSVQQLIDTGNELSKVLDKLAKESPIVNSQLARTDATVEKLVGIDADHFQACYLLECGTPNWEVRAWLRQRIKAVVRANENTTGSQLSSNIIAFGATSLDDDATTQVSLPTPDPSSMESIFRGFSRSTVELALPCHMMEQLSLNRDFLGRVDIMDKIDAALLPASIRSNSPATQSQTPTIAAVFGVAGLGKTQLASQYVSTRKQNFDAIFWICAESAEKLELDFCKIATRIRLVPENEPSNPTSAKELIHSWLAKPTWTIGGKDDHVMSPKWLLVFDNADDPQILDDYIDVDGPGSILVTSRNPLACDLPGNVVPIPLPPFSEEESLEFLKKTSKGLIRSPKDHNTGRQLHHQLDGLPLALAQMAGIAKQQFLSFSVLKQRLDDHNDRGNLFEVQINKNSRGNLSSLFTMDGLGAEPQLLAAIISCFHPDHIEGSIFDNLSSDDIFGGNSPMNRNDYFKARATLLYASIIRENNDCTATHLSMHRVPQQVIRANLSKNPEQLAKVFSIAVKLIRSTWPMLPFEQRHARRQGPVSREVLSDHVNSLHYMYETEKSLLMPRVESFEDTEFDLGTILQETAWWLYERGNFLKARETAAKILLLCDKYEGVERWLDLSALVYDVMGCVANGTNRPEESEKFNSKQLIIRKEISGKTGKENFQLGYAFNQMGCSLMMFKKFEEGGQMFRQALDIWHRVPGYRKGLALMEYANFGMSLWLQGRIGEAAEVLEEGQRESEEGLGRLSMASFRPGRVLHALGNVRLSQGRMEESEQFHKDALKTYQGAVGSKYHRTADMCYKLAQHSVRRGDRVSLNIAM
ncbi:tetratricopeptide repeat domain-containing protein [Colletotrichum costaricense]|uniref:Tetratricopeptide repeat domain-containing protein n=1 Tax=Colletotrichum costaricense TaxID=1209916 RepID=A0AAJ0DZR7_9PEZI|nr:tetratricopeptide repeat domain-containing protein [Colletotrichum costaricense]KAK1524353.1 tetratricopeptide repeat domain-containing protein [Colletotrichum costaricense]